MLKINHYLRHEYKVNENKVSPYCKALRCETIKNNENLQTYYHFKIAFQEENQHTRGKWLIHGTKHRKDNQLQSLELHCRIS